jgi:hypothetical protein
VLGCGRLEFVFTIRRTRQPIAVEFINPARWV